MQVAAVVCNIAAGADFIVDGTTWTTGFQPLWQMIAGAAFLADRTAPPSR